MVEEIIEEEKAADEEMKDGEAKEGEEAKKEEPEKKKKIKKTNLEFTEVRPMSCTKEEMDAAFEKEVAMTNVDRIVKETADMKNDLKSYITICVTRLSLRVNLLH